MFQRIKSFWAAFTADHHAVAMQGLRAIAQDEKVGLADVEQAFASARARLKAKQADYYIVVTTALSTLMVGVYLGHKFWT